MWPHGQWHVLGVDGQGLRPEAELHSLGGTALRQGHWAPWAKDSSAPPWAMASPSMGGGQRRDRLGVRGKNMSLLPSEEWKLLELVVCCVYVCVGVGVGVLGPDFTPELTLEHHGACSSCRPHSGPAHLTGTRLGQGHQGPSSPSDNIQGFGGILFQVICS